MYQLDRILVFCLGLLLLGCTEFPDCQETRVPYARVDFFDIETNAAINVIFDEVRILESNYRLYQRDTLHQYILPLNPEDTTTTFAFTFGDLAHTIVFSHQSRLQLVTPECGPIQYFYDLDIVATSFDSVVFVSRRADLTIPTNVQIYF